MRVLLVFIALVGAYIAGMVSTMYLMHKISPVAFDVLEQDIKWKKAEMKNTEENDEPD